jgi:ubiquitin-protein ligase
MFIIFIYIKIISFFNFYKKLCIIFPHNYPEKAPHIYFYFPFYHPNINLETREVMLPMI